VPSGWSVYYIVFVAGALSLAVPVLMTLFSFIVSGSSRRGFKPRTPGQRPSKPSDDENPTAAGKRTNPRAFGGLNAALALIAMALLLLPCTITLSANPILGLLCVLALSVMAVLALLYGIRKKDLDWLSSYKPEHAPKYVVKEVRKNEGA
jgi:NADH:ubiquinone oxidoreductase subunit 3 (subunit A)